LLNEVLRNHDDFRSAKISSFGIQRISEGFVFVGEVWRIDLEYENGASTPPTSIAAKFSHSWI